MFIKSILDLCRFKFKILSGKFTYVKMGANFAIKWVGDSEEKIMATRKKKATIFYPFDPNGKLMGYTEFKLTPEEETICSKEGTFKKTYKEQYCASEPTYTTIEWRPNTEFEATLELQDTQRNGCSSKKAIWVDTVTGEEYEMFIKNILDLCRVKLRVLSGKFTYVKMGANFAIKWIGD